MKLIAIGALALLMGLAVGCGGSGNPGVGSFGGKIIGIEPGAGIMAATENAIETYGLDFELQDSSTFAMMAALKTAVEKGEDARRVRLKELNNLP